VAKDQNYQGDSAMQISTLIWLDYVPNIFEKQDLMTAAKSRVVVAYKHIDCCRLFEAICSHSSSMFLV
jgi:hypothetical protein